MEDKISVASVDEFLEQIEKRNKGAGAPAEERFLCDSGAFTPFFRGESADYGDGKCIPKLFREDKSGNPSYKVRYDAERQLLVDLISCMHDDFRGLTRFEQLSLAQHYGLPTRLVDVTLNPLVALYFACGGSTKKWSVEPDKKENAQLEEAETEKRNRNDGVVYALRADNDRWDSGKSEVSEGKLIRGNVLSVDSDILSVLAHFCLLRLSDKVDIFRNLSAFHNLIGFHNWKHHAAYRKLIHNLRKECAAFELELDDADFDKAVTTLFQRTYFVKPVYSNARVRAQSGGFMLCCDDKEPNIIPYSRLGEDETGGYKTPYIEFRIKSADKGDILKQLDTMNINKMTLFPELASAADYVGKKYEF